MPTKHNGIALTCAYFWETTVQDSEDGEERKIPYGARTRRRRATQKKERKQEQEEGEERRRRKGTSGSRRDTRTRNEEVEVTWSKWILKLETMTLLNSR